MALTDKLTAIADAVRAKTGGTALLTLDEIVSAIGGISGGGGPFTNATTLGVYEATEDVSAIQIDWLTEWDQYDLVIFKPSITFSASDWLYINTNAVAKRQYFSKNTCANEKQTFAFFKNGKTPSIRLRFLAEKAQGTGLDGDVGDRIIYVYLQPYTSTVVFKSGSKVEVIGVISSEDNG